MEEEERWWLWRRAMTVTGKISKIDAKVCKTIIT
jgi:hypothetical protein